MSKAFLIIQTNKPCKSPRQPHNDHVHSQLYFREADESCDAFSSLFENTTVRDLVCNLQRWFRETNEHDLTYKTLDLEGDG